jgi:acetyl esterase
MTLDVASLRAASRARAARRPPGPATAVTEVTLPAVGIRARLYASGGRNRPLVVFLHGGMWILGDLDTHDRFCRRLAVGAAVDVLAVDYRRAPEHRWPAAVDDAVAALRWARRDPGRVVAIAGDSAGGCLAALACLRIRDDGESPPAALVVVCPDTDLTCRLALESGVGDGGLDPAVVREAAELWAPDPEVRADDRASPLYAERLDRLPRTLVITAERDPLRAEGDAFASRLADAGVPVTHCCEAGLPHGFIQGMKLESELAADASARLFADVARLLRTV